MTNLERFIAAMRDDLRERMARSLFRPLRGRHGEMQNAQRALCRDLLEVLERHERAPQYGDPDGQRVGQW